MEYKAWVVVADSSRARIFGAKARGGGLTELEVMYHPESRLKDSELQTDKPGRMYSMQGEFRSATEQTPARKIEAERFAQGLAEYLDKKHHEKHFERLVLAASPTFLGQLRNECSDRLSKAVVNEINKDLSNLEKAEEIRKRLPEYLW
ncbi:host attachment protein [Desulfovermiculus halophilus]|uniref:host attachment protein n=1 Tax=Desulfovermiculus halophilus TaxID=339722 RepID=UPI000482EE69|nr:host attachment protein [Desulfovermiculus halophilus]